MSPPARVPCPPRSRSTVSTFKNYEGESFGDARPSPPTSPVVQHRLRRPLRHAGRRRPPRRGQGPRHRRRLGEAPSASRAPSTAACPATAARPTRPRPRSARPATLASPAALAVMAGSVARGSYVEPALSPHPPCRAPTGRPSRRGQGRRRAADADAGGRDQRHRHVLKDVPGGPVPARRARPSTARRRRRRRRRGSSVAGRRGVRRPGRGGPQRRHRRGAAGQGVPRRPAALTDTRALTRPPPGHDEGPDRRTGRGLRRRLGRAVRRIRAGEPRRPAGPWGPG